MYDERDHPHTKPVIIQTMWRTGGTYLAFMLRERNPVALFYEPLHEDYSRHRKDDWDRFHAEGAERARGHPRKDFHYLTDYPFLPDRGVRGHIPDLAWYPFVLGATEECPELEDYLRTLLNHAAALGRRPVFKFCRGFLRQAWISRAIEPVTVYLARSPAGMMRSYRKLSDGAYFLSAYLRILHRNRNDSLLAPLYERVIRLCPDFAIAPPNVIAGEMLYRLVPPDIAHDVFLFFWAIALAMHCDRAIGVLDANALGLNPTTDEQLARALSVHLSLDVDLSEAHALDPPDIGLMDFTQPGEMRTLTRATIDRFAPAHYTSMLSPALERQLAMLSAA